MNSPAFKHFTDSCLGEDGKRTIRELKSTGLVSVVIWPAFKQFVDPRRGNDELRTEEHMQVEFSKG